MRTQTFDAYYLHTAVRYFKVTKDLSRAESKDIAFDEDGRLVVDGETFTPERETSVRRGNPYAVRWDLAWFEIDPKEDDEDPPTRVEEDHATRTERLEKDYEECGHPGVFHVVTHHHVAVTKRAVVTNDTEAGRTAQSIIDDYPNVEEIEFSFKDDSVEIEFENHGGELTCPLREVARSTRPEPHAVYLGHGKMLREDESWTMCQQHAKSLKKRVEELELRMELMEERDKRRRLS